MLHFFFEGDDYYTSLEAAIRAATISIKIEIYIFKSDQTGWRIADLLLQKIKQGVSVWLLYDAVGCRGTDAKLFQTLKTAGAHVARYNPLFPPTPYLHRRNHRKMVVVDGAIAFLGGFNFGDEYSCARTERHAWRDTGIKIEDVGTAMELARLFRRNWFLRHFRLLGALPIRRIRPLKLMRYRILTNEGWLRRNFIRQEYLFAIARARLRIWITNSYFVPDRVIRRALKRAARRGVDVRILVPGQSDMPFVQWAARASYGLLLKAGVKIFEYQNRVLHAKSGLIDDDWFTVGTSNLDAQSLLYNLEVNLFGQEATPNSNLAEQFKIDLQTSHEILLPRWKKRPLKQKILASLAYLFRGWL